MHKEAQRLRELFDPFLVKSTPESNGDYESFCPAHEDPATSKKPSARINFTPRSNKYPEGIIHCFVCQFEGTDSSLKHLEKIYEARLATGWRHGFVDRGEREGFSFGLNGNKSSTVKSNVVSINSKRPAEQSEDVPLPDEEELAIYREALAEDTKMLAWLKTERGITAKTAREWGLGVRSGRLFIPVLDETGELVNARLYQPHAKDNKMVWLRKRKSQMLFGYQGIEESPYLILLEGELDCILARQDGLPAFTHTAGAGAFLPVWAQIAKDKVVFVCYDNDKAGLKGRETALKYLQSMAEAVYFINLPGDGTDYTEFRIRDSMDLQYFNRLIDEAKDRGAEFRRERTELPTKGEHVTISESFNADRDGKPVEMVAHVVGRTDPPYSLPRQVDFTCDLAKGPVCLYCPMATLWNGSHTSEFRPDDDVLPKLIDAGDERKFKLLRSSVGAKCSDHLQIDVMESHSVEQLTIEETIERKREQEDSGVDTSGIRQIYNVGHGTKANISVRIVGQQISDPRNSRAMFMSWVAEPVRSSLEEFEMTDAVYDMLGVFRPIDGQTPLERMQDIADDMAYNVTKIYGRADMHIAFDVVWHSLIRFNLLGSTIDKGWVEGIVIGDSRTGKSELGQKLSHHYQAGSVYACDQASLAGLVGGVSQPSGRQWQIKWGAIPLNDMRLMVLDESQSLLDKDIIPYMSSIRSSGIAEITKIETSQTTARTRLIWIANPPSGTNIATLPNGAMDGISQMMPAHEDIARFDFAMGAGKDDVPAEVINSTAHRKVQHRFRSEACLKLVMWAWSRRADQVKWVGNAEKYLLRQAIELGTQYTSDFPLIQAENIRIKLARIAAAIAARTFSSDETGEILLIKIPHVKSAVEFLHMVYDNDVFGYGRLSRRIYRDAKIADTNFDSASKYFAGKVQTMEFGPEISRGLRAVGGRFETKFLAEASTLPLETTIGAIRLLTDMKLLRRGRGGKYLEVQPLLADILRNMDAEEDAALEAAENEAE